MQVWPASYKTRNGNGETKRNEMEQERDQSSRCHLRMRILILMCQTEWTWRADLSKFARVQTDSEDELQLFLSSRQWKKLRGAGARRKVTFSSAVHRKAAKIVSVISSGSSSESVCAGCRGGCNRDASSPSDNVIRVRKEQHLHYNVVTRRQQPSSTMNVHYHTNLSCPRVRCLSFNPAEVKIPEEVGAKLSPEQWLFLIRTFGID